MKYSATNGSVMDHCLTKESDYGESVLPFQAYARDRSWTGEHHVHLRMDPSCEPSQEHGSDLIR